MDFFDELGAKLTRTGQKTKKLASDLVGTAKTNNQINDLNRNLRELYAQLGEQYYQQSKEAPTEGMEDLYRQIGETLEQLSSAKIELQRLKNVLICPVCGHENTADSKFCAQCSAPLPQLPKPSKEACVQGMYCQQCGAKLSPSDRFCTKCGARVEVPEPEKDLVPEVGTEETFEPAPGSASDPVEAAAPETPAENAAPEQEN